MFTKLKNFIKEAWFDTSNIFYVSFKISLNSISCGFNLFNWGFDFTFNLDLIPSRWKTLWNRDFDPKNHKMWELQLSEDTVLETGFTISWTMHQDHAGLRSTLSLLGLEYFMNYVDDRHWNYDKNCFY